MHSKQQNVGRYLTQRNVTLCQCYVKSQRQIPKNFVLMLSVAALVQMYTQQKQTVNY